MPAASVFSGTLELHRFDTAYGCQPYQPPPGYETAYKIFRASLDVLPEESVVSLSALSANRLFDYQERSAESLATETYASVQLAAADPVVAAVPSTLQYSFSDAQPDYGLYYIWTPDVVSQDTRLIFFLHGFGGCFRYYAYFMKQAFPDDIVVLPVYGYSGALITRKYMQDLVEDLRERGVPCHSRPWLIGISAGGYAMFNLYGHRPEAFAGGISLASLCLDRDLRSLSQEMSILMINGDSEQGIPEEMLATQHREISERVGRFKAVVLEGDHFFLFTNEEEVIQQMRAFVEIPPQPSQ